MGGLSGKAVIKLFDQVLRAMSHKNGKNSIASINSKILELMRHTLLIGETLRAFHTKVDCENINWLRYKNSGTVKVERIGQSACLLPKDDMLVYGRASETERVWVDNDGLNNQSQLKIQSIPLGKLRGIRVHIQINNIIWSYYIKYCSKNLIYYFYNLSLK